MIVFKGGRSRRFGTKSNTWPKIDPFLNFTAKRRGIFHSRNISFDSTSQAPPFCWKFFFFRRVSGISSSHISKLKKASLPVCERILWIVHFLAQFLKANSESTLEDEEASPKTFSACFCIENFQETGKMFRNGCFARWFRFNWFSTSPQRRSSQHFFVDW